MREINEQWVENGRMYKAVEGIHLNNKPRTLGTGGCDGKV